MPKKSKKEKILADLRRRVRTEQSLTTQIPTLVKEETAHTFRFQVKKEAATPAQTQEMQPSSELTAIKRDLYKTFILATLAIAVEIIIYFVKR
ncbi:MAG: hypothetical protein NT149_02845 [Candidatus Gottesmanbacteria bacterium]|nr:hypothetical protein [Candidatus Gottesmanbacteria bacterium]